MTDPNTPATLERRLVPTPSTDPNGLAAAAAGLVSVVLVALGATDVVAAKWAAVAVAVVAVAGPLLARLRAWAPAKVWVEAAAAEAVALEVGRRQGATMPPATPPPASPGAQPPS